MELGLGRVRGLQRRRGLQGCDQGGGWAAAAVRQVEGESQKPGDPWMWQWGGEDRDQGELLALGAGGDGRWAGLGGLAEGC